MPRRIDHCWRLFGTALSFSSFGIGGLLISLTLFPAMHLFSSRRDLAHRRCQYVVHKSFQVFIWLMRTLGVLTYEVEGGEKLVGQRGRLIVANHPSLIDVVFIGAMLPQALCVVKKAAWSNPFLVGVMWATGYVQNVEPFQLIEACIEGLTRGNNLIIFPEGTRTVPGRPMRLKRGAASIIIRGRLTFIPITITSKPTTLTKAEKWYQIPETRVHFRISVGDSVDPRPKIIDGEALSLSNRRINRLLKEVLLSGIARHERID